MLDIIVSHMACGHVTAQAQLAFMKGLFACTPVSFFFFDLRFFFFFFFASNAASRSLAKEIVF